MKTTLIPVALLVALFSTLVWWQGRRIDEAREQIGQSSQRIADLAQANTDQTTQLKQAAQERAQAYAWLSQLGTRLDEIAQQTNRSTHAVKESLAPTQGRPNCRDEPLPADTVRLLKPPAAGHSGAAGTGTAPGRTDAPLP
ncbi:hypothetical protein [Aeromonas enterica]